MASELKPETQRTRSWLEKINGSTFLYFLLSLHALLFMVFYLSLSYYNRLGRDESLMIYFLNKFGLVGAIKYYYLTAEGNFTSNIIYCIIFQWLKNLKSVFVFHFFFLALLYASIYFLLRRLAQLQIISVKGAVTFLLPALLLSPFFIFNLTITEAWFWPTAIVIYQIPLIILFFAFYFLLSPSTGARVAAFILFIFFGGTKINYVLMVSSVVALYYIYAAFTQKKINRNAMIALAGLLLGLVIYLISPSNEIRMKGEAVAKNFNSLCGATAYNVRYIFTAFLSPMRLFHIAVFMSAFLWLRPPTPQRGNLSPLCFIPIFLSRRGLVGLVIALNIILLIENAGIYFMATGKGVIYPRVWTLNFFVLILTIAFFVYMAGEFFKDKFPPGRYKLFIAILLLYPPVAYLKAFSVEYNKARELALAYDKRVQVLESYKGKTVPGGVLYLEPLPEQGITNYLEIDSEPESKYNQQVVLRFGLNCEIAVKKNPHPALSKGEGSKSLSKGEGFRVRIVLKP